MAKKKPIVSKEGQWKYPGQETIIPNANGRITMQGVPYPVLGIDDQGYSQMMMPGAEYQFPGNSVYEIPMAKNGGTRRVKIHGLPKAQNGKEVQTVYTAGTNEPWEPLPEMNPEEAKQWANLRDDAVGITGNYATNAQIYATYKRAKEMGLGYDQYVSNEKAKAQQQRDAIVPKPIPGLGYDVNQLKKLSELPGSPFMYNQSTGEYYLPYGDSFKISDPALRTNPYNRPLWEAYLDPDYDSEFYAKYHNDGVAESIADINDPLKNFKVPPGTAITPELIEERRKSEIDWFNRQYGVKYDPTVDYTITPDEVKQHLFKKPDKKEPVNRQAFYNRMSNSYQDLMKNVPGYKYGDDPEERYDIIKTRERDKEINSELNQPLAKFLGATRDNVNPNILKRANAIASDKVAERALLDFNHIVTPTLNGSIDNGLFSGESVYTPLEVANTEEFRSFMNMDPKLLEAIANSPFGGGTVNFSNNKDAVGNNLAIGTSEAKKLLAIRNAIAGSDMWSYLNDPTPVDAMIQGTANTLSWMAGNENAEGPGTLGEMAHNLTGYQAQNKGLDLLSTIGGIGNIGGNLLTNSWNGVPTDVPTYQTKPLFHSYTDPTTANVYQGLFDMANDPVGLLTGTKAASFATNFVGDTFRAGKKFNKLERRLVHAYGAGSDIRSNLAFANVGDYAGAGLPDAADFKKMVSENKPKIFSPIDTELYSKNPKTGKSVLDMSGQYGDNLYRTGSQPIVEDAKYWNDLAGRTDLKEGSKITPELARLHIKNVLDIKKPKASSAKNTGVKFDYFKSSIAKKDYTNASAPKKWTKEELESHIGYLSKEADDQTVLGLLKNSRGRDMQEKGIDFLNAAGPYALAGVTGLGAFAFLEDDYIKPLANKYFPAFANKLGLNDLEVDKDQVTIDLSEEGSKLSAVRVNDTEADGNVILGGEFIYNNPNTVNSIKWFKENPTASLGDPSGEYGEITTETAPGFWGLENGKLKAGALQDFSDETVVVPIRPSTNAFKPIKQAGVAEDGGLRMLTDSGQENDGLIFNNARTEGKLLFYSPKTGKSYYVYNNNPQSTAAEINRLVSENEDLRYIMLDNGRYSHYKDKGTEKLTEEDFKEYAAGDIGKEGNPGYNIVFKRKDSKKFGGPINFRNGGQLPKAQFGPPTASDSAMVASKASQVGNWLVNNGYTQLNSNPANFSNPAAFRQDLEGGIRRFTNANNSGNIIDFRTGNRGSFPGNYTLGYNGNNVAWSQRDMASGVLNPDAPPSYYDTRILPQRFDVYDAENQFGNYDSVGKYTYEKLAVTPWKKLTNEQKIKRLKRYGASGSPYKDPKVGIKELKGLIEDQKTKKIAKVEPPVVEQPSQISNPPANVRIPFTADPIRRQFPITTTGDEALDRLNQQLYGNFGTLTEDGYIPTDDPKYYPYKGIGPGTPAVRRSYGKFANGGFLPKAQFGYETSVEKDRSGAPWVQNDPYLNNFNTVDVPENLSELPSYRGYTFAKGSFHPMTAWGTTAYDGGYTKFDDKTGYLYQPNTKNLQDFQSLPMEGDAEFNLRRFVLNPYEGQQQTHDVYTRRDTSGNVINDKKNFIPKSYSKEETMDNVFKDLYGQNLYKFKGNRETAYDATKEFMKNRVEPQYNGKYYEFMNNPDVSFFDKQNISSDSKMTVYDSSAKDHLWNHFVGELYEGKDRDYLFNLGDDERMDELNKRVYGNPKFKEKLDSYNEALQDWYVTNKHMTPEQAKSQVEGNIYKDTPWDKVRKSTGKFQRGGDISIPDLRRVKINALPKAQDGTPRVKLQEIQDLQDKYAVPSGYVRVPDVVRQQRLAKGIPANQIPEFEKITKSVSPKLQSIIDTQETRSAADKKTAEIEKYKKDVKNFRRAPINDPAGLPSVPIFEAALMAPVALASTAAALNAPLLGTGVSAANIINPLFFGQGIKNTLDSQSDMRKSWSNLYNDRTKSNLLDAALETGLNSLNFLGAKSLGSDLNKIGNYAGNTVNSIRNDFNVIKNARKYAADMQWQAPDDVFNVINTQRSGQLGSKQLRLKGSPNITTNSETSNSIVKGMPTIEYQEMLDNRELYDYNFVNKRSVDAILASDPNISRKIITGDSFVPVDPPELQSRDALQKAFDEGDRFGLMWGIKDLDNYKQMSKLPLEAYKFNKEESKKLATEKFDIDNKIATLDFKIANKEDEVFREYLINQKGLSQQDASDIVDRGITPPGTTRATFYFEAKPYWESKLKPTGIYDELDKLKKEKSNIPFKEARISKDRVFIQNELDLVDKYSENFLDPEFKRKIQELYKEAGYNMPFSTNMVRNVDPANSKLIYYNENEPTFLGLPDHSKKYLKDNFTRIGGFANPEGTFTIGGKSWFNSPDFRTVYLRTPKKQKVERQELVKRGPAELFKPNTWLNPIMGDKVITRPEFLPVPGADTALELIYDDRVRMEMASDIGDIAAHEAGHPLQRIYDWKSTLGGYDADYNYFKSNDLNPLSKRYQDAMVNADKSNRSQTWLAAPHELHSELMTARLRQARKLMTDENLSMEDAIKRIKGLEKQGDTDLFKSYLSNAKPSDGGLNKHFKDTTPENERIELLKFLPMVIGTIGGAGVIGSQTQEKKKGGQIRKFQNGGSPYTIPEQSYRNPNFVRDAEDREYYDPQTETIHMRSSYPNIVHEQWVKDHETAHHNQKLKGKLSSTENWPGPLKEPVVPMSDDEVMAYYNRGNIDVNNLIDAVPESTLFGMPDDVLGYGFQLKTYGTPGTAEYEASTTRNATPRTLYRGKPVAKNAVAKTLNREEKDPEMMFKDKYNTSLTKEEEEEFNKWAAKESKQQGRDILMDKGAYDIQGFWKSGDWKNRDADNHGTDLWKKPNHPTFSNQSKYHGAGGWYGGNWTEDVGYQPSKQTLNTYEPYYYDWLFGEEPNRPEYLDMSRYDGTNLPTPIVYQKGGPAKRFNTKLRGQEAEAFNQHAQQFPSLLNDKGDYDTQGFYRDVYNNNNGDMNAIVAALTPGSETAHVGTDRYKKPNHPTFSKESKYHIPILRPAGQWGHNEEGNYDYFNASRRNIKNMTKSDGSPLDYFKRAEDYNQDGTPDVKLFYKGQPMFKEGGSVKRVKINALPNNWKTK